jgi:oxygen-independent coproporphyrinogen-3 oxidase
MAVPLFDPDLIRRYDVNGPRYTSYPTADRFRDGDWLTAYEEALSHSDTSALSVYLHVPFCSTICFYCACNKINTANMKRADSYVQRLVREMTLHSGLIDGPHTVEQLHFGGGTPTFLSDDQFEQLFDALHSYFRLAANDARDFSVEIDPRNVSGKRIEHLAKLGVNRLSVGVQDFDPAVQLAVNRIQSVAETRTVIDAARSSNVKSINIDLINGLPKQTLDGFSQTLEQVISLQPDRLSLYSYAHLPHRFKTQKQINADDLPDAETKLKLLGRAIRMLNEAGYVYVGMDHFAKASDPLVLAQKNGSLHRNFQGYTTHGHCQLLGLGLSSIGNVGPVFTQNAKHLHAYYQAIDEGKLAIVRGIEATEQDVIIGTVIQNLMCRSSLNYSSFQAYAGEEFRDYFTEQWPRLRQLENDGLIELRPAELVVTGSGQFLLRNICMVFDTWLRAEPEKFSRAI